MNVQNRKLMKTSQGVKHVGILKFRENVSKKDFKKSLNQKRVENWKEKHMYGQFIRDMPET